MTFTNDLNMFKFIMKIKNNPLDVIRDLFIFDEKNFLQ